MLYNLGVGASTKTEHGLELLYEGQFGCGILTMVGPKIKIFQNNPTMNYGLSRSAKIVLSKSIFYVKNRQNFFKKKISFKNINLGDHFLQKTFFF